MQAHGKIKPKANEKTRRRNDWSKSLQRGIAPPRTPDAVSPRQCPTKKNRLAIATLRSPDVRRPSDRKCKVVGTDTRTMRRYASLQYYIKYCFIHLPTPCPSSTSPQLRSTFDAVSWDDFCQMGVQLYLDSTTSEHLASCLRVKAPN